VLLLIVEALIGEAPKRGGGSKVSSAKAAGLVSLIVALSTSWRTIALLAIGLIVGCGWNPSRPFEREAPAVREAVADLDAGDAASAANRLEDYLSTGPCKDGNIGTPESLKGRSDGTFDLGLALFRLGEVYGRRFGEEEIDAGISEESRAERHARVECAVRVTEAVSEGEHAPTDLRARALYLRGNLSFLDGAYEQAVAAYDRTLALAPGEVDAGDAIGRDAAWNRAIALRRIEDEKDAGRDAQSDASRDAAGDAAKQSPDAGRDASKDTAHDAGPDQNKDAGPPPQQPDASPEPPDAGAEPPPPAPSPNEDERMLDQLENAPTLQQEEAKRYGKKRVRGMADK